MPNAVFVNLMEGQINTSDEQKHHFLLSACFAGLAGFPVLYFLRVFPYGGAAG
jgi:hypothetical protein